MRRPSRRLSFLAACGAVACFLTDGEREVRVPGNLIYVGDTARIQIPLRATVGMPISVVVTTVGDGCYREGPTDVAVQGLTAHVAPFDYRTEGSDVICPSILREFRHEASLTFSAAGPAVVRIHGRRQPYDEPVVLTRSVLVE